MLSDEEIAAAECRARRFSGAYTGTSGTLAADVIHLIHMVRHHREAGNVKEQQEGTVRFATGAVRSSDAEATRYDLISPIGLEAVARTCAEGAAKYGDWNWEAGMPVTDLLNHALRHVYLYLSGDRSEDHLPHAAWGLLAAIHSERLWPELNQGTLRGPGCRPPAAGCDGCADRMSQDSLGCHIRGQEPPDCGLR
jgi:hypothetical protein